ncbi:alpha/beta fold hydrolase [Kribbella sindirgiensis]|uniref:Alpha/beta fold hydrolase n=1 Tax=Kribbella sindirgiensis TaxID=1124744 RepID=A0A4R0I3U5_9ACTN|nr:alpha/beta hydrolase [Kribbella sindirgiensis]TCC20575.1 alpha/beta fold hydrolase [Kribbella sindirgiensis]
MRHGHDVEVADAMACLRIGDGPPLVFLPGLTAHHRPPHGLDLRFQRGQCALLAHGREVWWLNRRCGLSPGTSMADLARDYARVMHQRFGQPVDVVGVSTGGSVALQLAADHPEVVRRLVVVSAAYRLGPFGHSCQRETADALRAGRLRAASAAMMSIIGAHRTTRRVVRMLGWFLGPFALGRPDTDLLTTLEAEDAFDLRDRLTEITAPTLVVGGARDACYGRELLEHTAELIPRGTTLIYPRKGHLGVQSRRIAHDIRTFLDSDRTDDDPAQT